MEGSYPFLQKIGFPPSREVGPDLQLYYELSQMHPILHPTLLCHSVCMVLAPLMDTLSRACHQLILCRQN